MSDDTRVLESLGKLSGLVEASREDIKTLVDKQEEHGKSLQTLATSVQVINTAYEARATACGKEFGEINRKLGRDYDTLNELKTKAKVENGVEEYKGKKREWWQWALGIAGAILGILIAINQLIGLEQKLISSKVSAPPAAYSAPLLHPLKDTLGLKMHVFTDTTEQ